MRYIKRRGEDLSFRNFQYHYQTARLALRYSILSAITGKFYRKLSRHVADSILFQWFTHTAKIDVVNPVSKSTIERFEKMGSSAKSVGEIVSNHTCNLTSLNIYIGITSLRFGPSGTYTI